MQQVRYVHHTIADEGVQEHTHQAHQPVLYVLVLQVASMREEACCC